MSENETVCRHGGSQRPELIFSAKGRLKNSSSSGSAVLEVYSLGDMFWAGFRERSVFPEAALECFDDVYDAESMVKSVDGMLLNLRGAGERDADRILDYISNAALRSGGKLMRVEGAHDIFVYTGPDFKYD